MRSFSLFLTFICLHERGTLLGYLLVATQCQKNTTSVSVGLQHPCLLYKKNKNKNRCKTEAAVAKSPRGSADDICRNNVDAVCPRLSAADAANYKKKPLRSSINSNPEVVKRARAMCTHSVRSTYLFSWRPCAWRHKKKLRHLRRSCTDHPICADETVDN